MIFSTLISQKINLLLQFYFNCFITGAYFSSLWFLKFREENFCWISFFIPECFPHFHFINFCEEHVSLVFLNHMIWCTIKLYCRRFWILNLPNVFQLWPRHAHAYSLKFLKSLTITRFFVRELFMLLVLYFPKTFSKF